MVHKIDQIDKIDMTLTLLDCTLSGVTNTMVLKGSNSVVIPPHFIFVQKFQFLLSFGDALFYPLRMFCLLHFKLEITRSHAKPDETR